MWPPESTKKAREAIPEEEPPPKRTEDTVEDESKLQETTQQAEYIDLAPYDVQRCEQLEQELEAITREWKKSARELGELRTKDQAVCQLPDSDLIERAKQLRYAIWNFSIQYFEGEMLEHMPTGCGKDIQYFRHLQSTTPESSTYRKYLGSPTRRAKIIAAFLWKVLTREVFDGFHWAGEKVVQSLRELRQFLEPGNTSETPRPAEERTFQMWSAKTTHFLLDALRTRSFEAQEAQGYLERRKADIIRSILRTIGLGSSSDDQGISKQLDEILDAALALDKDISQQVARVEWRYEDESLAEMQYEFDQETMELDKGDSISSKKSRKVQLVIAPALVKRGKSTGEDFHLEQILMKMVVCCE